MTLKIQFTWETLNVLAPVTKLKCTVHTVLQGQSLYIGMHSCPPSLSLEVLLAWFSVLLQTIEIQEAFQPCSSLLLLAGISCVYYVFVLKGMTTFSSVVEKNIIISVCFAFDAELSSWKPTENLSMRMQNKRKLCFIVPCSAQLSTSLTCWRWSELRLAVILALLGLHNTGWQFCSS